MALANVAWRMADKQGQRVLVVDWDLEAPGLHNFFGLTADELAQARGVLDFLYDWREAVRKRAPAPPDVRSSIVPITRRPHAPRFGSLSLLIAGRMDAQFDARLGSFDWQEFYEKDRGAKAIETLRQQITEDFDIVLVDSRTGLTDTGGICTIQLPDGVMLLTAPNEQSFRGIERVAQGIVGAPSSQRGGREAAHLWLIPSRISVVEEGYLAEEWYRTYDQAFAVGLEKGIWNKENHPSGLRSHEIPFRARWSFGEQLLHDASGVSDKEILVRAYDQLAETLRQWQLGVDIGAALPGSTSGTSLALAETRLEETERRQDTRGMGKALLELGEALMAQKEFEKAMAVLERAAGIFQALKDEGAHATAIQIMGSVKFRQREVAEARKFFEQSLAIADKAGLFQNQVIVLGQLALLESSEKNIARAQEIRERLLMLAKSSGTSGDVGFALVMVAQSLLLEGQTERARQILHEGIGLSGELLSGPERKEVLDVFDQLSDVMESTKSAEQPAPSTQSKPTRKPRAPSTKKRTRSG